MIIINRSCFSAVVPRPCAADVEPLLLRLCRGEGWAGGTLVNNYPVAGRCQKPINRHHSTTLHRPRRPKMNMYAYTYITIRFFFISSKLFFFQRWCMRVCQNALFLSPPSLSLSLSVVVVLCVSFSSPSISLSPSLALFLVCPPYGHNNHNSST